MLFLIHPPKMPSISKELLYSFRTLADKASVSILAIADTEKMPIVFASKTEELLGYTTKDLIGQQFSILLPLSVRNRHRDLMNTFKKGEGTQDSRAMQGGLSVKGLNKTGDDIDLLVDISYHNSVNDDEPGIFLAFLQDPVRVALKPTQLSSLKIQFGDIFDAPGKVAKLAWGAIVKKVTTTGGVLGFAVWVISSVTPLGTALRGFIAAWNWQAATGQKVADVRVYSGIDEETRLINLVSIRDVLREIDDRVLAVVFYKYSYNRTTGKGRVEYRADSDEINGSENWFQNFTLDAQQNAAILNHECVFVTNQVQLKERPGQPMASMIMCPTFTIGKSDYQGLDEIKSANIAAFSVEPGWVKNDDSELLTTTLWRLATPNLDVNFSPILRGEQK